MNSKKLEDYVIRLNRRELENLAQIMYNENKLQHELYVRLIIDRQTDNAKLVLDLIRSNENE